MHEFEHTIEIEAPVEQVFAFNSDPTNWPRVTPGLSDLKIVEETDDVVRMEATYKMLGISMDGEMTMSVDEDGRHVHATFESDSMSGEMDYHFRETDLGTEIVQSGSMEFGDSLPERILEPVARRYNLRQFKNSLANTKDLLEAEAEAEAGAAAA